MSSNFRLTHKLFSVHNEAMPAKKPGRPRGAKYPVKKLVRMTDETSINLKSLARLYVCSEAEAIRRAIHDTLRCELRQLVCLTPPPTEARGERE